MVLASADFTFLTVIQLRHIEIERLANADTAQNIVNITEANLHQTLQQSAATPVLFYFCPRAANIASS